MLESNHLPKQLEERAVVYEQGSESGLEREEGGIVCGGKFGFGSQSCHSVSTKNKETVGLCDSDSVVVCHTDSHAQRSCSHTTGIPSQQQPWQHLHHQQPPLPLPVLTAG